ncbi:uncharacterized protein LOC105389915 isoform X2 [Plutella xylostella]|uniref:uncharacterized protein LOC105389915 isoform X2 n=1 Tax=Plutella xylostella TaxID=51655 RepID=UPI0020329391|nr:uncharacterized protein LOC105389915 isoform X2 [Plutella xylostella]
MEGEGMVAIVRALRNSELAVTVLDSGRQYTLLPSHLAQSPNKVPTKQPRIEPQTSPPINYRPTINFNPDQTHRHDLQDYARDRTIDRGGPWRSNEVRQKATQYRDDGLMARGSQAVDGHYASTYQTAHCHVVPTSPPMECTEFPPQRPRTCPGQENFVVGGAGSGETYSIPTRGSSFRGGWTEQGPTSRRSPRRSPVRSPTDSFAASLRRYPSPPRSREMLQRLISYTQAKLSGSGCRSPRRASPSRLSDCRPEPPQRRVKSATCSSRSAYDTAKYTNNSQRTYSVRADLMRERSESRGSREGGRRSESQSLHEQPYMDSPYNEAFLCDYGKNCPLKSTEVQAAPVKISKEMSTVPRPCPAQRTIALSNSSPSLLAVIDQEGDTCQANLNSSPCAKESSFKSKESQTNDIMNVNNSNNGKSFVFNERPNTVSHRNYSTVYLLQHMQPCCSYSESYAVVKKESVSNLHREILTMLEEIPIRPTSDPYEKTLRKKTLQQLYNKLRNLSNIVETKSTEQDLLRNIREALKSALECEKCRRQLRKRRCEATRINYSKLKQNRRRKLCDSKIQQTTMKSRKQSLAERFEHTVLMWFETLTLESNDYEYRLAIKNTILKAFIEQLQKCAEDKPDNQREYKSILKGETLDFLDEIPLVVTEPCNTRVHMHRVANKLVEALLELHAEEKLLEKVSGSSRLMMGNSESTDCVFNDHSFTIIQPREDDIKREIRSELKHILSVNFTRDTIDKIEQDLSDIILDSMDAIRFEKEEIVIIEMIDVLRNKAHFKTSKACVIAKMILKRIKRFRTRNSILNCPYAMEKPNLMNKCSSETYLVYQGTSDFDAILPYADDDDEDISLTGISNTDIDSNVLRYKELISQQIDKWLSNLKAPLVEEQGFRQLVVNDLATDIVDRHKYVELNPSKKVSDVEELNYLRYQIFKWINKLAGEKNKETILQAPELMKMINSIPVPILTSPEQARALSNRAQFPTCGIKRPTDVDNIVTVTSDWLKAIPAQFKPKKPFTLCHSKLTESDFIEMRAEELADSLRKGINKTKFPNDFIDAVIDEWAKKLWKKRRAEHFDLLLELKKRLKHIQFVENTGSYRQSARGCLNTSMPVHVKRKAAERRKSAPAAACKKSGGGECQANSGEAPDNQGISQEAPIQQVQPNPPSIIPSSSNLPHDSPPTNATQPPSGPVIAERSSLRRPENGANRNTKQKKVNLSLPNELETSPENDNNSPHSQLPQQRQSLPGSSRETREANARIRAPLTLNSEPKPCGSSCPSSQGNTGEILTNLEQYIQKWADEVPIETQTNEQQEFAAMARQGIRNGIIMQIIKIRADPAAVSDIFLCQDILAQRVDELLDCLPETPELLAKRNTMRANLLEYVCNTNEQLQQASRQPQPEPTELSFGSPAYMQRYIRARYTGENEQIAQVFHWRLIEAVKDFVRQFQEMGGDENSDELIEGCKAAMDRVNIPDDRDVYLHVLPIHVEEEIKIWMHNYVRRRPLAQDSLVALRKSFAQDAAKVITNGQNIKDLHKVIEDFLAQVIEEPQKPYIPNLIELLEQRLRQNTFINSPTFIDNIFMVNYDDFVYDAMNSTRNPDCPLPCRPPPDALLQKRMEVQNAPPAEHSLPTWLYEGRDHPPTASSSSHPGRNQLESSQSPRQVQNTSSALHSIPHQGSRPVMASPDQSAISGTPVSVVGPGPNPRWVQQDRGQDGTLQSLARTANSSRFDQSQIHESSLPQRHYSELRGTPQLQSTPRHALSQTRNSPDISAIEFNESAYVSNAPVWSPVNVQRQREYELPQDTFTHTDFSTTIGTQQRLNISDWMPCSENAEVCRQATPEIAPNIQPQVQVPMAEPSAPSMRHSQEMSRPVQLSFPSPEQPIHEGVEVSVPGTPIRSPEQASAAPCGQRSPCSPVRPPEASPRAIHVSSPSTTQHSGMDSSVWGGTIQRTPPPPVAVNADVHQPSLRVIPDASQQEAPIPQTITGGLSVPPAYQSKPLLQVPKQDRSIPSKFQGATSHPTTSCDLLQKVATEIALMGRDSADSARLSTTVMAKVTQLLQDPNIMEDDFRYKKSLESMLESVLDPLMFRDDQERSLYLSDVISALFSVREIRKTEEGVHEYRKEINNVIARLLTPRAIATHEQANLVQPLINNLKEVAGDALVQMVFDPNTISSCKRKLLFEIDQYIAESLNNNLQIPLSGDEALNTVLPALEQIPPPPPESLTEDVELIRLKNEVLEWFKTLPLEAASQEEQLQENAIRNVLARRLHAVEREEVPSSPNYTERILYEANRWLRELRLLPGANMQQLSENLLNRLRSTEGTRNTHGTSVARSQTGRSGPTAPVTSDPARRLFDSQPIRRPEHVDRDNRPIRPARRQRTSLEEQITSDDEEEEECRCGEVHRRRNYCMPTYMPHCHGSYRGYGHRHMPYSCPYYR